KPGKAGTKLYGGESIIVVIPGEVPLSLPAQDIPIDVVFEDQNLIVVNKPAGMGTPPGAGVTAGERGHALLYHCGEPLSGTSGVLRPEIVHRLDKDTPGLLVVAKNDKAHQQLALQIKKKDAHRVYVAVLEGSFPAEKGIVDKPIGRHP